MVIKRKWSIYGELLIDCFHILVYWSVWFPSKNWCFGWPHRKWNVPKNPSIRMTTFNFICLLWNLQSDQHICSQEPFCIIYLGTFLRCLWLPTGNGFRLGVRRLTTHLQIVFDVSCYLSEMIQCFVVQLEISPSRLFQLLIGLSPTIVWCFPDPLPTKKRNKSS